jgi:hypothetical protein
LATDLTNALTRVPLRRLTTTLVFRHVHLPGTSPPDPFFVRSFSGRWGAEWTLHTASSVVVTWAEYCRNAADLVASADPTGGVGVNEANLEGLASIEVGDPLPQRALYALTYALQTVADLTTADAQNALSAGGFDLGDFYADDYGRCPEIAIAGTLLGWEALVAPSAAWRRGDGVTTAVLEAGRPRLVRQRELAAAARPTVAVAYGTSYKTGERPVWLGGS